MEKDTQELDKFYRSVKAEIQIDNLEGKQRIIKTLYEKFFKATFPKVTEQLGIVYTPIECVDFMIKSIDDILRKEFNSCISDRGVHLLDPFTGTGTFIVRLLQSGLIKKEDLEYKYLNEIHCNEIMLLAYYVADINIEAAYHELSKEDSYLPYDGICLTDTFQLNESKNSDVFSQILKGNSDRVENQKKQPIMVCFGNPPYSVGQKSSNDNAQNLHYPMLEDRIAKTYVAGTKATLRNSLYDSYIKAFRWASDRIQSNGNEQGIIAFISNGGWLDGNAMDGMRKCLEEEFSSIYVLNLRGNCRTSGENRRKEGDGIFGLGSRTPVTITFLVKNSTKKAGEKAIIYYHDIGDYLDREKKLQLVKEFGSVNKIKWDVIKPNEKYDWINQRGDLFDTLVVIGDKKDKSLKSSFFKDVYSNGLKTNRDTWCYNSSKTVLEKNLRGSIDFYNNTVDEYAEAVKKDRNLTVIDFLEVNDKFDSSKFVWDRVQKDRDIKQGKKYYFDKSSMFTSMYRPFFKSYCYFNLNSRG
jgi:predicted helicase